MTWHLENVEARSMASSNFQIPTADARRALMNGDHAKLIFDNEDFGQACVGERMWVQVTNALGDGKYVGILCNYPTVIEGIEHGDAVEFSAEHVCDIERRTA